MHLQLKRPKNLLSFAVATALLILVATYIPSMLRYTQVRIEIDRRYFAANWAKDAVFDHALAKDLSGLSLLDGASDGTISFSATTGIITLAFTGFPDAPGGTLRLVPLVDLDGVIHPLDVYVDMEVKRPLWREMVRWICLPAVSSTRDPYLLENRGTLTIDLAPAECR